MAFSPVNLNLKMDFTNGGTVWQGFGGSAAMIITDGASPTLAATVAQFHNTDNQILPTSYGLMSGGVPQLVNQSGNLDRQRETSVDGVAAVGIASGTQQLASPITGVTSTQAITLNANAQTVTVSGLTFSARGQVLALAIGSVITIDTGANAENVVLTAVGSNAISGVFTKNHSSGVAVVSFAYNQARDATIADGTAGTGIAANGTFLLNANGGWEAERSASGELDGASGTGTAVAAEYEFNGGGPHGNFDRSRTVQGKYPQTLALASSPATGQATATLSASSPATLKAGMSVQLTGGTVETLAVQSISGTSITFTTTINNASHTGLYFESFASYGPGLAGFSPLGMGIEEEAVYDPVSNLFYLERSATGDGMAAQNIGVKALGVYNGATVDRLYGSAAGGAWVTVKNGSSGNDYSVNKPAIPNVGAGFGATGTYANYVNLGAIPASVTRNEVEVINTAGAQIVLVLDDGTAALGSAPANASVFALAAGNGVGSQGGAWQSAIFKGRIQIYALSLTAQVLARVA